MANNTTMLIMGIIAIIAVVGLILAMSGASGLVARPPEFDAESGCYYNPTQDMKGNIGQYTCYRTVRGKRLCCLNEYVRPL